MSKQFGYGPRAMNPANLNKRNADLNPSGQNPDLITDLETAYSSRSPDSYADLIAIAPNIFDSYAGFVAAADDLVANYGAGGTPETGDAWVVAFNAWVQANGTVGQKGTFSNIATRYPGAFTTFATFIAALDALVNVVDKATSLYAMWASFAPTYNSTAPFAMVPHAKTSNTAIGADMDDMNLWLTALAAPSLGGIAITTE
jgi:hypothetical protein